MIKPWEQTESTRVADFRIFTIRSDHKISPRTGKPHDFYIIESVNWVNVIPVTSDNQVVLIEQYRHGSNTVELEVPGGMMDPGDNSPLQTAARELAEETGYTGDSPVLIGDIFPNPAIMNNVCHTVLVENCRLTQGTQFDSSEDVITRLVPVDSLPGLVAAGKIRHSLVVVALYHFELYRRRLASTGQPKP